MNTGVSTAPRHVAIIMDGNNRWARQRKLREIAAGHKAGVETIRGILRAAGDAGVEILTLFAFSSENWSRPKQEVEALMQIFASYLASEVAELHEQGVRIRFIGRRDRFRSRLRERIGDAERLTAGNTGTTLVIAADYGGRWDIARGVQRLMGKVEASELQPGDIDEALLQLETSLGDLPVPDLLIRTGGEHRISNFLLWECAYSELWFTDTLWPDFTPGDLLLALNEFSRRERRFGAR